MIFRCLLFSVCLMLTACGGSSDMSASNPFPAYSDDQSQFLAMNAARNNVMVTDSGLQYEVLTPASGAKPSAQSMVTVHYVGTLTDGTEFDSSYSRNQPATFQLAGTIPGWIEGLQLMSVGSEYRFVLPPQLAYGDTGAGTAIGPGEALIFVVELLEINAN